MKSTKKSSRKYQQTPMSMKGHNLYEFGDFVLDTSERQLRRDDEVISIQPKAFATLCLLVENQGKLLTKDFMMNELWADTFVEERNLAQNIFSLRKSLGKDKNGLKFIETVPKQGYRFVAEVRPLDEFAEDEIVEVSLSQKTTISAIGDFSDAELAEAVRATSESLTINQNQTYNELKQIETPQKSHFFSKFSPVSMFAIALISLLSIGATIWFWKYSNTESSKSSNPLANVKILNTTLKRLTNSGKAWNPAVSPDNKQIAYVYHDKNKDSLRLQNLATGSVTEVVPPTDGSFGLPVFSADGNYIFYSVRNGGNEGTILKTPIYGGSQQQIMTNTRSEIAISRDGEWLSFVRYDGKIDEYQLMVCRTNGTDERILKIHKGADSFVVWGTSPAWSFNGKKVAAISYNPLTEESKERVFFIAEIDFETGHERKIAVPTIGQVQNLAWLQDGEHLVVTAQDKESDTFQLWKIHRTNGEVKRITNDLNGYSRLSVSADGNFLLTNERTEANNLAIVDVASGSMLEELTSDTTLLNGYYGVMWTPDSKEIVYAQTNSLNARLRILQMAVMNCRPSFNRRSLFLSNSAALAEFQ